MRVASGRKILQRIGFKSGAMLCMWMIVEWARVYATAEHYCKLLWFFKIRFVECGLWEDCWNEIHGEIGLYSSYYYFFFFCRLCLVSTIKFDRVIFFYFIITIATSLEIQQFYNIRLVIVTKNMFFISYTTFGFLFHSMDQDLLALACRISNKYRKCMNGLNSNGK